MASLQDFDDVAGRIRLHSQADARPFVVVEGFSDRSVCLEVWGEAVVVFRAGPKPQVLRVAGDLRRQACANGVALVDRDVDSCGATCPHAGPVPVVHYDSGDLEAMLLLTPALDRLLEALASGDKLSAFGGTAEVRRLAVEVGASLARLRRYNEEHNLGVAFDRVDLTSKIDPAALTLRAQPLAAALSGELLTQATALRSLQTEVEFRCPDSSLPDFRGRDALAVVAVALRRRIGSLRHETAHPDHLERVLVLAATRPQLERTPWFSRMSAALERAA